jgi:phage gp16-like protein
MTRNASLAKIHIAKKQLGLDEETYRAMLLQHGGASSSKDLTIIGAAKVLAHLERCGFKPKAAARPRPAVGADRQALMRKVEAQLADAKLSWAYADGMAKRICKVDRIEFCDAVALGKIVAALAYQAGRRAGGAK